MLCAHQVRVDLVDVFTELGLQCGQPHLLALHLHQVYTMQGGAGLVPGGLEGCQVYWRPPKLYILHPSIREQGVDKWRELQGAVKRGSYKGLPSPTCGGTPRESTEWKGHTKRFGAGLRSAGSRTLSVGCLGGTTSIPASCKRRVPTSTTKLPGSCHSYLLLLILTDPLMIVLERANLYLPDVVAWPPTSAMQPITPLPCDRSSTLPC